VAYPVANFAPQIQAHSGFSSNDPIAALKGVSPA